jgi:two-component system sensor histidine kinase TctE
MIKTYSIRGQLLKWLLIPTMILVLIDSSMLYHFAGNLEQIAFDNSLKDTANDIFQFIKRSSAESLVAIDQETEHMILSDSVDKMYYSVIDDTGRHMLGDPDISDLPIVKLELKRWLLHPLTEPDFYFDSYNKEDIRIVSFPAEIQIAHRSIKVYVLVAETLNKRNRINKQILLSLHQWSWYFNAICALISSPNGI